jgi:glycosyltransferase involved in cell wall biosynthesis
MLNKEIKMGKDRKDIIIDYYCYVNISGYSNAAKHYILMLNEKGYSVRIKALSDVFLDHRSPLDLEIKEIMDKGEKLEGRPASLKIIHAVPPVGVNELNNDKRTPTIWFYAWEGKYLPEEMLKVLPKVEHCVTFSNEQVKIYKEQIHKDNVTYIPHVVLGARQYEAPDTPKEKGELFTFLSVFEWNARKDPATLLRAYIKEFEHEENVALIIKIISYNMAGIKTEIEKIVKGLRLNKVPPKIIPVTNYLSDVELVDLYKQADVYVSATRGEGYGIPFIESLFVGTPVLVPNKYIDLLPFNAQNSIEVETYDTIMFGSQYDINKGDNVWGQVSDVDLADKMRHIYETMYTDASKIETPTKPSDAFIKEYNGISDTLDVLVQDVLS